MAGYSGYSMSNNAVQCYEENIMPYSKWNKDEIINAIEDLSLISDEDLVELKKITLKSLRLCLKYHSWHHTSNRFNRTNFYKIDEDYIEENKENLISILKNNDIENKKHKIVKEKIEKEEKYIIANYIIWGGTRQYPKAFDKTDIFKINNINSKAINITDYDNKLTTSSGFKIIKELKLSETKISFVIENKKFKKKEFKSLENALKIYFKGDK